MSEFPPTAPLQELATITMGQSPEADCVNGNERGLPFLQGCAEFGPRFPVARFHCSPTLRVAKAGSTLISVRAPVGTTNRADQDYCIGRGLGGVQAKLGLADDLFLLNAIQHSVAYLHRHSQGSTFLAIGSSDLRSLPIPAFGIKAQHRIAEILTTIDEAIEQTEALIAKTQQIKAGLMHDLFTRGVLPNSQLRPPRNEAPQLYKESPLGWIPKEWEAQPCVSLTDMITVGIVFRPTQYYVGEGVPAFRSANIREDGIDPTDLVFISQQSNAQLPKSQVRAGDVLSVRTGYPGTSAVVQPEYAGSNCIDILISRPSSRLRSNYLAAWINSPFGKEQVLRKQGGLAQQHFNVGELRDLLVALPSTPEQDQIIARLSAVKGRLAEESTLAEKYQAMKCGLMNDLLTGRVRVPVVETQKVAANV